MKPLSAFDIRVDPAVEVAAERFAALTGGEAVLLFGSRARGDNSPDSDWDIFVVMPDGVEPRKFKSVTVWDLLADLGIPLQVVPVRRCIFEAK